MPIIEGAVNCGQLHDAAGGLRRDGGLLERLDCTVEGSFTRHARGFHRDSRQIGRRGGGFRMETLRWVVR
jgi:hypothetical protein